MKNLNLICLFMILFHFAAWSQNVGINGDGAAPDTKAMLDVNAPDKGVLVPRVALVDANNPISGAKPTGLLVWNTNITGNYTIAGFYFWNGTDWTILGSGANYWQKNTTNLYYPDNIGIGTTTPKSKLEIQANATSTEHEALFVVRDKRGDTVMAVFNDGVHVYIDKEATTGMKDFVVKSKRTTTSPTTTEFFRVSPDSTIVSIDGTSTKGKAKGFVVKSKGTTVKGTESDFLRITPDSTVLSIDGTSTKGKAKGFVVKSKGTTVKGTNSDFMRIAPDSTTFFIRENLCSGTQHGFVVKSLGNCSDGKQKDFLRISSDSTVISTKNQNRKVHIKDTDGDNPLLTVDGGLKLGMDGYKAKGVIQWNDTVYQGYTGEWVNLTYTTPYVATSAATNLNTTTATIGGNVTSDGGKSIIERGVCYSTSQNPTISGTHNVEGAGTGTFTSNLTGLTAGTTYYARAYATNSIGISYGNQISFTTTATPATVTDIDGNTYNTVTIGTQVWLKENLKTTKYANGDLITNVTNNTAWAGLTTEAYSWYNNDYATYGATYGALYNWFAATDSRNVCPTGWHVPSDGEWTTLTDYLGGESVAGGKMKESGTTHWLSPNNGADNSSGFTDLGAGDRYSTDGTFNWIESSHSFWSCTPNGTLYGRSRSLYNNLTEVYNYYYDRKFGFSIRCLQGNPLSTGATITTSSVSTIAQTTATCGGNVTADGGAFVSARGVCWGTSPSPTTANSKTTDGTGTGTFTSSLTGLTAGTTYYVRAYATNASGTVYGAEVSFTTLSATQVADIDGNVYNTVVIGTQTWMKENLKTIHYANGNAITNVTDNTTWAGLSTEAYSWYNNDISNKATYGALYNWYAASDSRNVCPTGWHVPSDAEWTTLTTYLGGTSVAGGKMKEVGTTHWLTPNTGADNSSGFTALPGGDRDGANGAFTYINYGGYCWSSTIYNAGNAWDSEILHLSSGALRYANVKQLGISIRCLKD